MFPVSWIPLDNCTDPLLIWEPCNVFSPVELSYHIIVAFYPNSLDQYIPHYSYYFIINFTPSYDIQINLQLCQMCFSFLLSEGAGENC